MYLVLVLQRRVALYMLRFRKNLPDYEDLPQQMQHQTVSTAQQSAVYCHHCTEIRMIKVKNIDKVDDNKDYDN